jgi:hypothetical protein
MLVHPMFAFIHLILGPLYCFWENLQLATTQSITRPVLLFSQLFKWCTIPWYGMTLSSWQAEVQRKGTAVTGCERVRQQ